MQMRILFLTLVGSFVSCPTFAEPVFTCATEGQGLSIESVSPDLETVEARVLFIAFPDADSTLPGWASDVETEFPDFIRTMSGGLQDSLRVEVVRRPAAKDGFAWVARNEVEYYYSSASGFDLNEEVMNKVDSTYAGYWSDVDYVFCIHFECTKVWALDCTKAGGRAILNADADVPGFTERTRAGSTQYLQSGDGNADKFIMMHEYGHAVGMPHPPGSFGANPLNLGRYDLMRPTTTEFPVVNQGLIPYSALSLNDENNLWVPQRLVVSSNTKDVLISDVFGNDRSEREIVEVLVPGSTQSFVLTNYMGSTSYEEAYQGAGLLIWHILRNQAGAPIAWDLEAAAGRFLDPELGLVDSLEADEDFLGSPSDFYDEGGIFSCSSNPNTNLYETESHTSDQSIPTSVSIENIRLTEEGDYLVDIFIHPTQLMSSPNGGDSFDRGDSATVSWSVRFDACIQDVAIDISDDGGTSFRRIGSEIANSGVYAWKVLQRAGNQYRFRVCSFDSNGFAGADTSDSVFTITDSRSCQ